VQPCLCI